MENTIKKITSTIIKNAVNSAINSISGISKHYHRIRQEEYYYAVKKYIERRIDKLDDVSIDNLIGKTVYIYRVEKYNQGNFQFPHHIEIITEYKYIITRQSEKSIFVKYGDNSDTPLNKKSILGYRLARKNTHYELTNFNNYLM